MLVRLICLAILVLELRCLTLSIGDRRWKVLAFYTQLSNLAAALSALGVVLAGMTPATVLLRYLSSCMLVMTFFVTTCVLVPMGGDPKRLLFSGTGLYFHVLLPVLSVGSYLLLEDHPSSAAWVGMPTGLTFLYGMIMLALNARGRYDGPYPFFRVRNQKAAATVLWMAALTGAVGLLSLAIYGLGR